MTIYRVYRAVNRQPEVRKADLLSDGAHLMEHNGLRVPVRVEGNDVIIHVNRAKGNLGMGLIGGFSDGVPLDTRSGVADVRVRLSAFESSAEGKTNYALTIWGDSDTNEPDLYIERHDRESRNFPQPTRGKERE